MNRRLAWIALLGITTGGCVVHHTHRHATALPPAAPPPAPVVVAPPPVPPLQVWYHDEHFIPDRLGGGWCYEDGPHVHEYYPDRVDAYDVQGGYYYYNGPYEFLYVDGHPVPGGAWCYARGRHAHDADARLFLVGPGLMGLARLIGDLARHDGHAVPVLG